MDKTYSIQSIKKDVLFMRDEADSSWFEYPKLLKLNNDLLIAFVNQKQFNELNNSQNKSQEIFKLSDTNFKFHDSKVIVNLETTKDLNASIFGSQIVETKNHEIHLITNINIFKNEFNAIKNDAIVPLKTTRVDHYGMPYIYDQHHKRYYLKKDSSGVYKLVDQNHLIIKNVMVRYGYDSESKNIYLKIQEMKGVEVKEYSLFDTCKNHTYRLLPGTYIAHLCSYDNGTTWEFDRLLNHHLKNPNDQLVDLVNTSAVVAPKIIDRHSQDEMVVFTVAELISEQPYRVYALVFNPSKKMWRSSEYLNDSSHESRNRLGETTLIADKNYNLYAFSKNNLPHTLKVSYNSFLSYQWSDLDGNVNEVSSFSLVPLNTQKIHGVKNFEYHDDKYILISLPTTTDARTGTILLYKNYQFEKPVFQEMIEIDEYFGNSSIEIIEIKNGQITFAILYETKISNMKADSIFNHNQHWDIALQIFNLTIA